MDAKAQRKALFRSKLKESSQNRDKRIDSPLVRYNENDQPVCRVCNVILKSESLWPAHQVSRKHHEAIDNVKAAAAGVAQANKVSTPKLTEFHKPRPASTLPEGFFDNQEPKRHNTSHSIEVREPVQKTKIDADDHMIEIKDRSQMKPPNKLDQSSKKVDSADINPVKGGFHENFTDHKESVRGQLSNKIGQAPPRMSTIEVKSGKNSLPDGFFDNTGISESSKSDQLSKPAKNSVGLASKQVKGALPEGFFDNKDADLRARGIEPVKVDINDAYKDFEKEIQEDLQGVDDRLEEEEIDAAEVREEYESLEQKQYREQVEMVKKQLMEMKAARIAKGKESPAFKGKESSDDSSSDEDDDDDFVVDWRAKRL